VNHCAHAPPACGASGALVGADGFGFLVDDGDMALDFAFGFAFALGVDFRFGTDAPIGQ
jgi:hypothetical protein